MRAWEGERERDRGKILRERRFYEPRQKGINCDCSVISGSPSAVICRLLSALSRSLSIPSAIAPLSYGNVWPRTFDRPAVVRVASHDLWLWSKRKLRTDMRGTCLFTRFVHGADEEQFRLTSPWLRYEWIVDNFGSVERARRAASSAEWKRKITCPEGPDTIKCSTVRTASLPTFEYVEINDFPSVTSGQKNLPLERYRQFSLMPLYSTFRLFILIQMFTLVRADANSNPLSLDYVFCE